MLERTLRRWVGLLAVVFALFFGAASTAQDRANEPPDYDRWEQVAKRAEAAVDDGETTTAALIEQREALAGWRARFLSAETANSDRLDTLKAQLDALGSPPDTEAGESEPADIAQRRAALNDQLRQIEAPRLRAQEAYNRANGMIAEIDDIVRTRQTEALLEAVPTPAYPPNWPVAFEAVGEVAVAVEKEISGSLGSEETRGEILRRAPVTLGLLVAAVLLLLRGRTWMTRFTDWVQTRKGHGRLVLGFVASITQFLVPAVGLLLLFAAIMSLRITGEYGETLLRGVAGVVITVYAALWLANRVFPVDPSLPTLFSFDLGSKRGFRRTVILVGMLMGLAGLITALTQLEPVTPAAGAVLSLPVILLLSYAYWRLSRQLKRAVAVIRADEEDVPTFAVWLVSVLGNILGVIAIVAPLAALAGYAAMANALTLPTGETLWLIGLFIALQYPIRDLYCWLTHTELEKSGEALVPVLVNFVLLIAAVPVLLLIWGVRPEQLGELYARFSEGFTLGDVRLTPGVVFTILVTFAIGFLLTRFFQSALKSTVLPRTRLDAGSRNAVSSFVGYVGIGLAAVFAITAAGIDLTALAYVFGALSLGIGFGLQNIVQNFVAGIILLIERPIGEGDWIEVGGQMGIVKRISVRSTTIETFDKQDVIVPNADFISGTVTNWTRGSEIGRAIVEVGVAYGSDTRRVEEILHEIAVEHPTVAHFPEPGVDFVGFGASSLDFRMRMILRDVNQLLAVQTEVRHRIAERFAEEGIEIPFAQQDIWLRNPETLRAPADRSLSSRRGTDEDGALGQDRTSDDGDEA